MWSWSYPSFIQRQTTIPNSNNRLIDKFIIPSPPMSSASLINLAPYDFGSPLFDKQLSIQPSSGTCFIVHWISPYCVSSPGDIKLSPCTGCAAHTSIPFSKKRKADLTLCTQKVSLIHSHLTSLLTWADIDKLVRSYSLMDSPEALPISLTIESSAAAVFANSPLVPSLDSHYIFL
uniref:Uncharacterized protein n=1 Tax=Rhizophagus irregularis (strain DAOM 181602 / DAOM 197198 / MUCL 43194) TaxID=747089 RepID=U9UGF5_RHIID